MRRAITVFTVTPPAAGQQQPHAGSIARSTTIRVSVLGRPVVLVTAPAGSAGVEPTTRLRDSQCGPARLITSGDAVAAL